jgi:hypothetical protein
MKRAGFTLAECSISTSILAIVIVSILGVVRLLDRQSRSAFESLGQTQDALLLLESIRLELGSLVMNPTGDAQKHRGNSFVISTPHQSSIQLVTERRTGSERKRFLVYYEATRVAGGSSASPAFGLRRTVWAFNNLGAWNEQITFPPGWPASWIGPKVEQDDRRWRGLGIQEIRWDYLVPAENEGKVFFRVKLVLKSASSGRLMPFTTLVAVRTPDLPAAVSDCPCLFASCFDPNKPDCGCCIGGTR